MLRHIETGTDPVDPLEVYPADNRAVGGRPWVMINMIASIDGATTLQGRSTGLSDEDDRAVFAAIRSVPDVILVGASTVKAEDYGPVTLDERRRALRVASGREPVPLLAIVSGRLSLDPSARVFSDPGHRPMILTGIQSDQERREALSGVAEVVELENLDAHRIIGHLSSAAVILCEGGPSLNGQMVTAGLVDEVNLTVAPMLVAGESKRIAQGGTAAPVSDMILDRVLVGDRSLFLRYVKGS